MPGAAPGNVGKPQRRVFFARARSRPLSDLLSILSLSLSLPSPQSGAYRVSGTMTAPVPAHVVWDVLTDFDNQVCVRKGGEEGTENEERARLLQPLQPPPHHPSSSSSFSSLCPQPDVFSSILASRVEPDPANPGALHIIQTCKWKWFLFGGAFEVRLAVSRADPPGRGGGEGALSAAASTSTTPATPANSAPGTLVFTLVSSPFLRSFEGTWTVAPCPLEPESGPAVVGHALAVTPALAPPSAAGGYVGRLFQKQVGGVLADLGEELGRRAAAQVAAAAAAKDGGVIEV